MISDNDLERYSRQIIIPEFDGRITTIPCSFKEVIGINNSLCSELSKNKVDISNIKWLTKFITNYIRLSEINNFDKKVCLIFSNYPIKNGRIGNGVGLNTPQTIINILKWLKEEGYDTGNEDIPETTSKLMSMLIKTRTNSDESLSNPPLDYLSLESYIKYWSQIPNISKKKIIDRWGDPNNAIDLDKKGFSINGILFGKVCLLIQPKRGYDINSTKDIHSPDLPPPHRYLAQYYWIENIYKSNAICHIGKHGTLEWLPGKSVGLSESCFPRLITPPIPNIYPFIVNDPGEGSQAKRRSFATIIDHLTPPLDRAELYGKLSNMENLLDEFYEAKLLNSEREKILRSNIENIVKKDFKDFYDNSKETLIQDIDIYVK